MSGSWVSERLVYAFQVKGIGVLADPVTLEGPYNGLVRLWIIILVQSNDVLEEIRKPSTYLLVIRMVLGKLCEFFANFLVSKLHTPKM